MAAVFVLLLSRFGLSSKTLSVIKKSPEGLKTKEALHTNALNQEQDNGYGN